MASTLVQSLQAAIDNARRVDFWDNGLDQSKDFQTYGPLQDFTAEASSWDTMTLGGQPVPGLVEVRCTKGRKTHRKDAPAMNGAVLTHLGYRPAEVTIKVTLWTPGQLINWTQLILTIFPTVDDGSKSKAYDVDHPALRLHAIKSLYVEEISPLYPGHVRGTMESIIRLTEYIDVVGAKVGNLKLSANTGGVGAVPQAQSPNAAGQDPTATDGGP